MCSLMSSIAPSLGRESFELLLVLVARVSYWRWCFNGCCKFRFDSCCCFNSYCYLSSESQVYFVIGNVCCLNQPLAIFIFPLTQVWWGNIRLAKTFEIHLVLTMPTARPLHVCKNDGSSKSIKNNCSYEIVRNTGSYALWGKWSIQTSSLNFDSQTREIVWISRTH